MKNNPPTFIRWTLTAGLLLAIAGCDDGNQPYSGELDRHAVEQALAEHGDEQTPLAPESLDDLVIEEPTVRDVLEGRIDAPKISSSFGRLDENGEVTEACPQREAALSGAPVEAPRDVQFDGSDELLLDTPLREACVAIDRRTGDALLTRCESHDDGTTLDADFELVALESTANNCYICTWSPACWGSWNQRKEGIVVNGQCVAAGFYGCC